MQRVVYNTPLPFIIFTEREDVFYTMNQEDNRKEENKSKNKTSKKAELSEEQRFIHKKKQMRKRAIENMRLEERWEDWDQYE